MNNELEKYLYKDADAYYIGKDGNEYCQSVLGIITVENPTISPSDINYEKIQHNYGLDDKRDLVWLKFTKDGYLGVIATSNDINFNVSRNKSDYDKKHKIFNSYNQKFEKHWVYNSSGILLHKLGKEWDEFFH